MKRRKPFRYRMDIEGPWLCAATALMGGAFFLRTVYYFGVQGLSDSLGTLLLMMAFPMILEAAFVIVLRGVRLNAPGLCGILMALYCVLLLVQSFFYGDVLRTILGVVGYLACGTAMLALLLGWFRSRGLVFTVFAVTAAVRFLLFDLGEYILNFRIGSFLPEAAALCALIAMAIFPFGLKQLAKKAPRRVAQGS